MAAPTHLVQYLTVEPPLPPPSANFATSPSLKSISSKLMVPAPLLPLSLTVLHILMPDSAQPAKTLRPSTTLLLQPALLPSLTAFSLTVPPQPNARLLPQNSMSRLMV